MSKTVKRKLYVLLTSGEANLYDGSSIRNPIAISENLDVLIKGGINIGKSYKLDVWIEIYEYDGKDLFLPSRCTPVVWKFNPLRDRYFYDE